MSPDYRTFSPRSVMGNPQRVQPSKKFWPPKICQSCHVPFQGVNCPRCDLVPGDA